MTPAPGMRRRTFDQADTWWDRMAVGAAAAGILTTALTLQHVAAVSAHQPPLRPVSERAVAEAGASGNTAPLFAEPPTVADVQPLKQRASGKLERRPLPVVSGIPRTVLHAYDRAADDLASQRPSCHLSVPMLAAIGRVESGHARGGDVDRKGTTTTPILGPVLNGAPGVAAIGDTDGGVHDGDTVWDRAVGPMQFIPSTWRTWGADGNADGAADPGNVFDASLAAGRYLCAAGGDLATASGLERAILAYNHSRSYLSLVLAWIEVYAGGTNAVPDLAASDVVRAEHSERRDSGQQTRNDAPAGDERPSPPMSTPPDEPADPHPGDDDSPDGVPAVPSLPTPTAAPDPEEDAMVGKFRAVSP